MFDEKIWVEKGFQTSINIAYDLHNENKVKSFIPTMSSIDVIEDVILSTSVQDRGRARILIGAYGRGKSHIVLMLMSLLFKKDIALFEVLLNKIKEQNPKLYGFITDYINSDKKLLPIIVSGSSTSITQSFLSALQTALKNEKLTNLMPETNFKAAVNTIELWENHYQDTYKKFISELNVPVNDFIVSLKEYDVSSYEKFNRLYPTLTSGSAFNPFLGFDVVELYEKVVDKLKDEGFNGVYVIYDEFSKYLESSIANTTISDIKLLQDFAEKCDRSGDKQMHLMLISHKDIANYIDKSLPKDKVDGWRGVSGRFKHINLHNNFSQMYEIISAVIKKDGDFWADYCQKNETHFKNLIERFEANGILEKNDNATAQTAVKGCYPLHPISTFILPRLSEKVAQNERTLFTFLSSDNKHTLTAFLEDAKGDFPMLTPDYVYDYFEPLLRKEPYTSEIHKLYETTSKVLQKLDEDSLATKIIKTISLIYIVEQFEKLSPIKDMIVDTFRDSVSDVKVIDDVLAELIEKECIIYLKRSNGYLKIKESSGVDIGAEIQNVIEKTRLTLSVKDILNKSSFDSYMYPTAYNDEMEITRYFDFTFIDSMEFFSVTDWGRKIENLSADGVVYAIIPSNNEEIEQIREAIKSGNCYHNRIIFVLPVRFMDIEKIAFEFNAVMILKDMVSDDELLSDEYDIYIEDLEEVISRYISNFTRPEIGEAEYYWNGEKQPFKRKAQISAKLSEICSLTYPNTPIINNESINKDSLPTVAINSRSKLISGLLENELNVNLGLTGTGQDVSFMRSTLIQTGILSNEQVKPVLTLTPDYEKMANTLREIQEFFNNANANDGQNFKDLYDRLTLPESGYGIKRGVIPIYIAVVLHFFKKYLVIKNKTEEVKINADLLNSINENPKAFTTLMEDWNEDKSAYINSLATLFSDHIISKEKDYNTFTYVVSAMSRWYMSLPKYAKELKTNYKGKDAPPEKISPSQIKFIGSLKQTDINAREYLFEKLFDIFGFKEFNVDIIDNIRSSKATFDGAKNDLAKHLISDVKEIFKAGQAGNATLTSIIKDFIERLKPTTLSYLFPNEEHKVLQLMSSIGNDEKTFIERLAKAVTDLRIDDWTVDTISQFAGELEQIKKSVSEYDLTAAQFDNSAVSSSSYKVSFIGKNGKEVVKSFDKTTYSDRGKLLYNEIATALDEMGKSIPEQEKRQILMEFIEKMCGGGI
ncbi:hypothetical protein LPY66_00395 [Dehalobacter sp. DCM]|uniref:hypothetical protein n=1 Tax=Dehalobacter sp. DCM TaxID=2907827 RepID=UPI00308158B8|nr:hypothetical protein LPY66_00395 [Dehalobacter sp. DCM]